MDRLERAIEAKRDEVAKAEAILRDAERVLERARVELSTLEQAASLRPLTASAVATEVRKGRQPGAISREWRTVLMTMWLLGVPSTYEVIAGIAGSSGASSDIASVRERIRIFERHGYVQGDPMRGYTVTDVAAERFGFQADIRPNPPAHEAEAI